MALRTSLFAAVIALAGCGSDALFLVPDYPVAAEVRVGTRTLEVRDVVLPAYAAESEILVQEADGALRPLGGALWADDPRIGVTQALARRLDQGTTATVAAEPWPLFDGPDRAVQVSIDRMVAVEGVGVELSGQFAMISRTGTSREFLRRFDITEPLAGTDPQSVADAMGRALTRLSTEIAASIAR
jgi:uncharacterized lipoprotein YmbA